jgi:hypothetical protein
MGSTRTRECILFLHAFSGGVTAEQGGRRGTDGLATSKASCRFIRELDCTSGRAPWRTIQVHDGVPDRHDEPSCPDHHRDPATVATELRERRRAGALEAPGLVCDGASCRGGTDPGAGPTWHRLAQAQPGSRANLEEWTRHDACSHGRETYINQ